MDAMGIAEAGTVRQDISILNLLRDQSCHFLSLVSLPPATHELRSLLEREADMNKSYFAFVILLAVLKSFGGDAPTINIHADHFFQITVTGNSK